MFEDRGQAGKLLSKKLAGYRNDRESLIIAIPRGGVVVAMELCKELNLPVQAVSVKKLGAPLNPELAIGAVSLSHIKYLEWDLINRLNVTKEYLEKEVERKGKEVEDRNRLYGFDKEKLKHFANFILVDDGIATGATTKAAVYFIKSCQQNNQKIILAVPVIAYDVYNQLKKVVDEIIVLEKPLEFGAVGQFYRHFDQVSDETVVKILKKSKLN